MTELISLSIASYRNIDFSNFGTLAYWWVQSGLVTSCLVNSVMFGDFLGNCGEVFIKSFSDLRSRVFYARVSGTHNRGIELLPNYIVRKLINLP